MNSNAHTVKTRQGPSICLADRRQPTTAGDEDEECAYTRWILLRRHTYPCAEETEMRDTSSRPVLSLPVCPGKADGKGSELVFFSLVKHSSHSINHPGYLSLSLS